jgi:electron transfer flavoprotein alpha subunit
MNTNLFVIVEHLEGGIADIVYEMLGKARSLADSLGGTVTAVFPAYESEALATTFGAADTVLSINDELLSHFSPQQYQSVLAGLIDEHKPRLVMIGSTSIGLDLASALAERLSVPMVSSCVGVEKEGDNLVCTSQMYGGKLMIESVMTAPTSIVQVLSGAFRKEDGLKNGTPHVENIFSALAPEDFRMHFENYIKPAEGDIDITQAPILISVGRGIQTQDNMILAEQLAATLGGAVSSSRPIVDQDWLPITRQVGKSGMTVKPKLYFALGISGAPEHVEGMKDADLIVGINSDPDAPIFSVAHYGVVADLFDIIPDLTEKLREREV